MRSDQYEQRVRAALAHTGSDLDAMAVGYHLDMAWKELTSLVEREALRELGLTMPGWTLIITIRLLGPQEIRTLAKIHRTSRASVVSCVHTLTRAGLVRRVRSTVDRRLVSVALTGGGGRAADLGQRYVNSVERRVTAGFSHAEKRQLARLLARLRDAVLGVAVESKVAARPREGRGKRRSKPRRARS